MAEETGWHIGDGSMNYYSNKGKLLGIYQLRGHIEDDVLHYKERIKPIFEKLYSVKINLREMHSTRVFGFQIWNNRLVKFKQRIGLPLGKKISISIPSMFLKSKSIKIAVIRGIFDIDGCVYLEKKNNKLYPRMEIRTISFKLSEQILKILKKLDLRATVYNWLPKNHNSKRVYSITIRGDKMFHKFMNIIKPANSKHINKYILYKTRF